MAVQVANDIRHLLDVYDKVRTALHVVGIAVSLLLRARALAHPVGA
jgi:hypothetical protein